VLSVMTTMKPSLTAIVAIGDTASHSLFSLNAPLLAG